MRYSASVHWENLRQNKIYHWKTNKRDYTTYVWKENDKWFQDFIVILLQEGNLLFLSSKYWFLHILKSHEREAGP